MRSSTEIAAEIAVAEAGLKVARHELAELIAEHHAAKVAEAEAAPHEWLGKTVKRLERRGYMGGTQARSGVVAIYDPREHRHLRELYNAKAGDLIVIHKNGRTAWDFPIPAGRLLSHETNWELA